MLLDIKNVISFNLILFNIQNFKFVCNEMNNLKVLKYLLLIKVIFFKVKKILFLNINIIYFVSAIFFFIKSKSESSILIKNCRDVITCFLPMCGTQKSISLYLFSSI